MLKVYAFCLDSIAVIDTRSNVMFRTSPAAILLGNNPEKKTRITKATIGKYKRDRGYVISSFILNEYAPDELSEWDREKADIEFIGAFNDASSLKAFIVDLYEITKPVRDKYHFVNFGSSLWEAASAIRRKQTEQNFNKYGNKCENDLALFRALLERGETTE